MRKIHRLLYAESRKKRRGANKKNIPEPKRSCESALFFANPFSRQWCADPRQMPLWQLMTAWRASVPIIARIGRSREIFPNLPHPRPLDHAKRAWSNPRPGSVAMQHDRKSRAGRGFAAPYDEWFPCVSARREALQAAQIPRGDLSCECRVE